MKNQYVSLNAYDQGSIQSVSFDLTSTYGTSLVVKEGYNNVDKKKKKRGMGIDCILVPEYTSYDLQQMKDQRNKVGELLYDPHNPYLYQFSPLFAKYPFGQEYKNIGGDSNMYLNIPSFIDENAKIQYLY